MSVAHTKPASRSNRWTAPSPDAPRKPLAQPLRAGFVSRISVNREAEAISAGRASAAAVTALGQARKASVRLDRAQERGKWAASAATLAGSLGLLGEVYAACLPFDSASARCAVALASTLAMALPLAFAALRVMREGSDAEIEAATAIEAATRTAGFAKCIGDAVASASDSMGLSPTALVILGPLLDAVEQDAATSRQRERIAYSATRAPERRPLRVKPWHDRVTVTPADGRKLTARVLDLSMAGVALETDLPGVGVGSTVVIGSRKALAMRKLARGMAFRFEKPIPEASFDADVVI